MPSSSLDNAVLYTMVFPNRPLQSIETRTFRSVCYVHVLLFRSDKLSAKSLKCVFLGYSMTRKGYYSCNPTLRRTFTCMDVTFFEDVPYYYSTSTLHVLQLIHQCLYLSLMSPINSPKGSPTLQLSILAGPKLMIHLLHFSLFLINLQILHRCIHVGRSLLILLPHLNLLLLLQIQV